MRTTADMVFGGYARYYDLLYQDKDYSAEVEALHALIRRHRPGATRILELGCGTGRHACRLAAAGHSVTGIDLSAEMIAIARHRSSTMDAPPGFAVGDARTYRAGFCVDVVAALFHVFNYLATDSDLEQALTTAAHHLEPDGILVFDFWYGPGVEADPPAERAKTVRQDDLVITRTARPETDADGHLVTVHYDVDVRQVDGRPVDRVREAHQLRYLFPEALDRRLAAAGLVREALADGLHPDAPPPSGWNAVCVARLQEKSFKLKVT